MMSSETKQIPYSSQTVGPYFSIGLEYLNDRMTELEGSIEGLIEIRGKVLDRDGAPVSDAMLEFWSTGDLRDVPGKFEKHEVPQIFKRVATDLEGRFAARMGRPVANHLEDGRVQAPHAMVLVFARGLMRHLITRVYLQDENTNQADPVMLSIPHERRATLVAKPHEKDVYVWDVRLQGPDETVFFVW